MAEQTRGNRVWFLKIDGSVRVFSGATEQEVLQEARRCFPLAAIELPKAGEYQKVE